MESVSNAASAAAKAVWGDNTRSEEPMSGVQGNVPRGEPFDAGNLSDAAQRERLDRTVEDTSATHPASTQHARLADDASSPNYSHSSGMMFSGGNGEEHLGQTTETPSRKIDPSLTGDVMSDTVGSSTHRASHANEKDALSADRDSSGQTSRPAEREFTSDPGAAASGKLQNDAERDTLAKQNVSAVPDEILEDVEKEAAVGSGDGPADAPSSDKPSGYAKDEAFKDTSAEADSKQGNSETGVMGDGPKSLADVAKEHGGDAGNSGDASKHNNHGSTLDKDDAEGEEETQESKGTGELYVRTTGLAADGGDFDATKPGAGREADRLMEEKGMSREGGDSKGGKTGGDNGEKPSLGDRIKNKLHKH